MTGFGGFNSGTGNVGLFNSGTGNVGFFNSGTGNWGIGNTGEYNTGIGNTGSTNTGFFNSGLVNTGVGNAGNYNTGFYNAGDTNSGSFNPGDYNTGSFNTGDYNTGWFNTGASNTGFGNAGNVNTGAFNTGNYNNGVLWRGDYQGLYGFNYSTTIPEFPWFYDVTSDIEIPISGTINEITQDAFTIAEFDIPISLRVTICIIYIPFVGCVLSGSVTIPITTEHLGPFTIDSNVVNPETPIDLVVSQPINFPGGGTLGPVDFGFTVQQSPGFFNSTSAPSSGLLEFRLRWRIGLPQQRSWGSIGHRKRLRRNVRPLQLWRRREFRLAKRRHITIGLGEPGQHHLRLLQQHHAEPHDSSLDFRRRELRQPTVRLLQPGHRTVTALPAATHAYLRVF